MTRYSEKTLVSLGNPGQRQFPGSHKIDKVMLLGAGGGTDITEDVAEIVFYESLESPFIFGHILINDIKSMIVTKRISGNETLTLSITDGVMSTNLKMKCYRVGNRTKINPQSERFVLDFCSFDLFMSQKNRVAKSYMNKKPEEIIEDMFVEATGEFDKSKFHFYETRHKLCCVIPNWDLSRACNFIAARSIPADEELQSNTYTFFQTLDGIYNFFPYEALIDEKKNTPFCDLIFDPARLKIDGKVAHDTSEQTRIIALESLDIQTGIDHIANLNSGLYANRTSLLDITTREVLDNEFNYLTQFDDSKHLRGIGGEYPLIAEYSELSSNPYSAWIPVIKSKGLFTEEEDTAQWFFEMVHKKISKDSQLENYVLEGKLPGHLGLMAGHIVNVRIPYKSWPSGNSGIDPTLSGQYLVKSVVRVFELEKFTMTVQLVRDSSGLSSGSRNSRGGK
jgi:hypothetical protein